MKERTPLRPALDRFVGWACRALLDLFYRRVAVVGAERIPERGPFIVVANHVNGLLDAMFIFGPLRLPARMLGKSTIWKMPVIGQLARLAGGIPVYRRIDPGVDSRRNAEAFAACHRALANREIISIFPEGISHDQPSLQPLKTGAARILLGAERQHGPLGSRVLPVGLLFEARTRFRSKALVVVGEPIDPAPELALMREQGDDHEAARALTARIAAALDQLTVNYANWEEARLIELGADVVEPRADREHWQRELVLRRTMARALPALREKYPFDVEVAVAAVEDYERELAAVGVADADLDRHLPTRLAVTLFLRTLLRLALLSPVAILGTLLNVPPWLTIHAVARRVGEANQVATYSLFGGLLLYPLTWIAEGVAAAHWLGTLSGVALGLVAPLAGWVALVWHERRRSLWRGTRSFLKLRGRSGRRVADELATARRRVRSAVGRLAELANAPGIEAEPAQPSSGSSPAGT